jgi:Cdc6-like AAA superfamily ATPase
LNRFQVSPKTTIEILPLVTQKINGFETNSYYKIAENITDKFDLYIVDGPFGSDHYSRYDIVTLAQKLEQGDEFIIIMDDYDRKGEKQTADELVKLFEKKNIKIHKGQYSGLKCVMILATEKYKYIKTL